MARRAWAAAFLAAQTLAIILYGFLLPPGSAFRPPCLFHALTGFFCPGCGMSRGIWLILRGDIAGGLRQNILVALVIPMIALVDIDLVLIITRRQTMLGRGNRASLWLKRAALPLGILVAAFWIVRNLPWRPFSLLAPR